jgi:hypothetical protein
MGDSERIRALEAKRERVLEELERTLIDEWDTVSAVHPPPLPQPPRTQVVTLPDDTPKPLLSNEAKRVITFLALLIGGSIAAVLKGLS